MIEIDTIKIKKCGTDLIKLSQDLSSLCNSMYDRINNMPNITGEWMGKSAEKFVKEANNDKINVIEFKNKLYCFGNELVKYANNYDDIVTRLNN